MRKITNIFFALLTAFIITASAGCLNCQTVYAAPTEISNVTQIKQIAETKYEVPDQDEYYLKLAATDVSSRQCITYTKAPQLSRFIQLGYWAHYGYLTINPYGSISITQGVLNKSNNKIPVYVIALSGTDIAKALTGQSTGVITDVLCGFQLSNPYYTNVKYIIRNTIPKGAHLVFTGHSLGGMIAQQCCADSTLKHEYDILNTVAFGSPSIGFSLSGLINLKEGTCVRLGDTKDIVPYLSVNTLNLGIFAQIFGLKKENGGYSSMQSVKAHCCSYQREDVWGNYDVLGEKNGKSSITLNFATTRWYQTPFK